MKVYNKLVRDNIPEIIKNDNQIPQIKILSESEYKHELLRKLVEEANEALLAENNASDLIKELGDLMEVMEVAIKVFNFDKEKIVSIKKNKRNNRGGFEKQIFLEKVEE